MMPSFSSSSLNVVATETLSKTASTATPASRFCSCSGMPSFSYVASSSGSTSSRLASFLRLRRRVVVHVLVVDLRVVDVAQVARFFSASISRKRRYALRRQSSSHSGSFFFAEIRRTMSSSRPVGIDSCSMSVTKPYWYSRFASCSSVGSRFGHRLSSGARPGSRGRSST